MVAILARQLVAETNKRQSYGDGKVREAAAKAGLESAFEVSVSARVIV